ncbi:hypothetical protein COBT_002320 [Conglomerata obtusa]
MLQSDKFDFNCINTDMPINYHLVSELCIEGKTRLFTDKSICEGETGFSIGLLMSPVFDKGLESKDNANIMFEIQKIIAEHVEKEIMLMFSDKNINFFTFITLGNFADEPLLVDSEYNVINEINIYDTHNPCFWLINGFYDYYILNNYFDTYVHCNPNNFKRNNIRSNENTSRQNSEDFVKKMEVDDHKKYSIFVSSNYLIQNQNIDQSNQKLNINNSFTVALLHYTILRLALYTFKMNIDESACNYYFERSENISMRKDKDNFKEKEDSEKHVVDAGTEDPKEMKKDDDFLNTLNNCDKIKTETSDIRNVKVDLENCDDEILRNVNKLSENEKVGIVIELGDKESGELSSETSEKKSCELSSQESDRIFAEESGEDSLEDCTKESDEPSDKLSENEKCILGHQESSEVIEETSDEDSDIDSIEDSVEKVDEDIFDEIDEECAEDCLGIFEQACDVNLENRYEDADNIKILNLCLIFYKEMSHALTDIGIEIFENVYSIYYFIDSVFNCLKLYSLGKKNKIDDFYDNVINSKIKINIFGNITNSTRSSIINGNPSTETINKKTKSVLDVNIKELEAGDFVDWIDEKNKHVCIFKRDATKIEIGFDNTFFISTILLIISLKANLTSVASQKTNYEYINYLATSLLSLNIQNNEFFGNIVNKHNTAINSIDCCSKNFQTTVQQTLENTVFRYKNPAFFYYNYYIYDYEIMK